MRCFAFLDAQAGIWRRAGQSRRDLSGQVFAVVVVAGEAAAAAAFAAAAFVVAASALAAFAVAAFAVVRIAAAVAAAAVAGQGLGLGFLAVTFVLLTGRSVREGLVRWQGSVRRSDRTIGRH